MVKSIKMWSSIREEKSQRGEKNLQKTKMSKLIMKYRHKLIICTREWSINTARQRASERERKSEKNNKCP